MSMTSGWPVAVGAVATVAMTTELSTTQLPTRHGR